MKRPSRAVLAGAAVLAVLIVVGVVWLVVRATSGPEKTIEVYADSSLRFAFADLATAFEEESDVAVDVTTGPTAVLTTDLVTASTSAADAGSSDTGSSDTGGSDSGSSDKGGSDSGGAPAMPDVFAAADPISLYSVNGLLTGEPMVLAEDRLVLVVPPGNPEGIEGPADLRGVDLSVCAAAEPCGRAAAPVLDAQDIEAGSPPGTDSRAAIRRVADGPADAGLVLASEAAGAGDAVEVIELPWAGDRVTFPALSLLLGGADPDEGQQFIDFVLGEQGQEILAEHGFASADNPHLQPED